MLYSQLMDAGRIDELAELFTEDAVCGFGTFGNWEGRDTIRENFAAVDRAHVYHMRFDKPERLSEGTLQHHGENLLSSIRMFGHTDLAVGRGYLIDMVTEKAPDEIPIVVIGVYDEEYRKVAGRWRIARCTLQVLWPNKQVSPAFEEPFGAGGQ